MIVTTGTASGALAAACALAVALVSPAARGAPASAVAHVVDGDTIVLVGGDRVRLLQIDTPELGSGECYSRAAARALRRLLRTGTRVQLEADPRLDSVDRFGRLLRYVRRGPLNVNLELVRRGAATVWFYDGARGRYSGALLRAALEARAAGRGLWGACETVWDPDEPATTFPRSR